MLINEIQEDALKELFNIGVAKGASILNSMLYSHIILKVPSIEVIDGKDFATKNFHDKKNVSTVDLSFKGELSGSSKLLFNSDSAITLVTALTGEEPDSDTIDSLQAGTLSEIGNVILNSVMGTISNLLKLNFNYSIPSFFDGKIENLFSKDSNISDMIILFAEAKFLIENLNIHGEIMLCFEIDSFDKLCKLIDDFVDGEGEIPNEQ